jgi:hypothetical protein
MMIYQLEVVYLVPSFVTECMLKTVGGRFRKFCIYSVVLSRGTCWWNCVILPPDQGTGVCSLRRNVTCKTFTGQVSSAGTPVVMSSVPTAVLDSLPHRFLFSPFHRTLCYTTLYNRYSWYVTDK